MVRSLSFEENFPQVFQILLLNDKRVEERNSQRTVPPAKQL